ELTDGQKVETGNEQCDITSEQHRIVHQFTCVGYAVRVSHPVRKHPEKKIPFESDIKNGALLTLILFAVNYVGVILPIDFILRVKSKHVFRRRKGPESIKHEDQRDDKPGDRTRYADVECLNI